MALTEIVLAKIESAEHLTLAELLKSYRATRMILGKLVTLHVLQLGGTDCQGIAEGYG